MDGRGHAVLAISRSLRSTFCVLGFLGIRSATDNLFLRGSKGQPRFMRKNDASKEKNLSAKPYEQLSKLLVSPLITPIVLSYRMPNITHDPMAVHLSAWLCMSPI